MTQTSARAALDRIEADEAFANRVKDAGGSEQSLGILRSEGFEVTAPEMRDAVLDRYGESLQAEQLDAIAGGKLTETDFGIIVGGGAVVTGMVAAAAAVV